MGVFCTFFFFFFFSLGLFFGYGKIVGYLPTHFQRLDTCNQGALLGFKEGID